MDTDSNENVKSSGLYLIYNMFSSIMIIIVLILGIVHYAPPNLVESILGTIWLLAIMSTLMLILGQPSSAIDVSTILLLFIFAPAVLLVILYHTTKKYLYRRGNNNDNKKDYSTKVL